MMTVRVARRPGALVVVVAALLVLVGCSASPPRLPAHPASSPVAATATPDPRPTALPGCAALVAPTAFGTALGADVATTPAVYPMAALSSVHGVGCELQFGEQGADGAAELNYQIAPVSIATEAELRDSQAGSPRCQTDPTLTNGNAGCEAVAVVGGWWLQVRLYLNTDLAHQDAAVQPVLDLLRAALRGRTPPAVVPATAPSCDRLARIVAADPEIAGSDPTATIVPGPDWHSGWPLVAAVRTSGQVECSIVDTEGGGIDVTVVPHAPGSELCVGIPGATAWPDNAGLTITTQPYTSGGAELCATDGTGSITTYGVFRENGAGPNWDAAGVSGIAPLLQKLLAAAR